MNTRISSKLAALAIALMMNGFIIGGVAYLFDAADSAAFVGDFRSRSRSLLFNG